MQPILFLKMVPVLTGGAVKGLLVPQNGARQLSKTDCPYG